MNDIPYHFYCGRVGTATKYQRILKNYMEINEINTGFGKRIISIRLNRRNLFEESVESNIIKHTKYMYGSLKNTDKRNILYHLFLQRERIAGVGNIFSYLICLICLHLSFSRLRKMLQKIHLPSSAFSLNIQNI